LHQVILDFTYFAKTVDLPFDTDHSSNAQNAPWVYSGGSYSGALSAWTESVAPGTFWAYHSSSAPVEAIEDFVSKCNYFSVLTLTYSQWQYFAPVQEGMPVNCSKDITLVIDYMDDILTHGSASEVYALKESFGLEALEHNDDFMACVS
jgi:hypothetical protein